MRLGRIQTSLIVLHSAFTIFAHKFFSNENTFKDIHSCYRALIRHTSLHTRRSAQHGSRHLDLQPAGRIFVGRTANRQQHRHAQHPAEHRHLGSCTCFHFDRRRNHLSGKRHGNRFPKRKRPCGNLHRHFARRAMEQRLHCPRRAARNPFHLLFQHLATRQRQQQIHHFQRIRRIRQFLDGMGIRESGICALRRGRRKSARSVSQRLEKPYLGIFPDHGRF